MGFKNAKRVAAAVCMPIVSKNTSKINPRQNAINIKGMVRIVLGKINKPRRYKNPKAWPNTARFLRNKI
jgi:hypothetical protein